MSWRRGFPFYLAVSRTFDALKPEPATGSPSVLSVIRNVHLGKLLCCAMACFSRVVLRSVSPCNRTGRKVWGFLLVVHSPTGFVPAGAGPGCFSINPPGGNSHGSHVLKTGA